MTDKMPSLPELPEPEINLGRTAEFVGFPFFGPDQMRAYAASTAEAAQTRDAALDWAINYHENSERHIASRERSTPDTQQPREPKP